MYGWYFAFIYFAFGIVAQYVYFYKSMSFGYLGATQNTKQKKNKKQT